MEVVDISGYSLQEKLEIAKRYLVPKQIKENGISEDIIEFKDAQLERIIAEYTMESGVRSLDVSVTFLICFLESNRKRMQGSCLQLCYLQRCKGI